MCCLRTRTLRWHPKISDEVFEVLALSLDLFQNNLVLVFFPCSTATNVVDDDVVVGVVGVGSDGGAGTYCRNISIDIVSIKKAT